MDAADGAAAGAAVGALSGGVGGLRGRRRFGKIGRTTYCMLFMV